MIGRAVEKYIKISPYKVRKIGDLIRGKGADAAMAILENVDKKARVFLIRALKSAIASAKNAQSGRVNSGELYISKVLIDDGPMMRRYRAAAMGRATMIRKRSCHITVELDLIPGSKDKAVSKQRSIRKNTVSAGAKATSGRK